MSWTNKIDRIFLINLPDSTDRLFKSLQQFRDLDIEVEIFFATPNNNGAIGLRETVTGLFEKCVVKGYKNILVFEDDVHLIHDLNIYMPLCLAQLPDNYDLFYLGAYIFMPFKKRYSENLILLEGALSTHAVMYPVKTFEKMIEIFKKKDVSPIDMLLYNKIIKGGNSYIADPLLASQFSGFSSIERKNVDYKKYIEDKYAERVRELK